MTIAGPSASTAHAGAGDPADVDANGAGDPTDVDANGAGDPTDVDANGAGDPTDVDAPTVQQDPRWYRPVLCALLVVVAVAYLWDLGASRWSNSFYSAAVQAGSTSWKAFFFGSFDAANAITVDKPPASLWIMGLSVRLFGLSPWSVLVPEALMGVGSVALVAASVKRWFRPGAALLAAALLATTPVAALMFRFNNPDALLVLLLCGAAYAVTRAVDTEGGSWRWLALAGGLVGFGFLTKMLQAFVVGPAFAGAYLVAASTDLRRRIRDLAVLAATTFLGAAWWIVVVELWPASRRPYIGGSQHNSVLELVFGYNGLGRLTGHEVGSVLGKAPVSGTGRWGPTGWLRMFNPGFGGQISWLLPAALLALVAGMVWTAKAPRTDRSRAALIIWGGWLLVTGLMFSFGQGIIHEYYSVALAPAIAALVGIGSSLAWDRRDRVSTRIVMAVGVGVTAAWATVLLGRTNGWNPWLAPLLIAGAVGSVLGLMGGERVRRGAITATSAGAALAVGMILAAPTAATVDTISRPHTGVLPTAGPSRKAAHPGRRVARPKPPSAGSQPRPPAPVGPGAPLPPGPPLLPFAGRPSPGLSSLLKPHTPSAATTAAMRVGAERFEWVLATVGSNNAAGYQLATRRPVLAIGGFNGTDPFPTFDQFRRDVASGAVHYFVPGLEGGYTMGGSDDASRITDWVRSNFGAVHVGDEMMYDLTDPVRG